jgi:hypothetical protein
MGPRQTYRLCGYQQITSLGTAVGLTIPTRAPDGTSCRPNAVLLQAEAQTVRFRADGTAPTTTVGMILQTGQQPYYYDGPLQPLQFIQTAASGILNVFYLEDESI